MGVKGVIGSSSLEVKADSFGYGNIKRTMGF